MKITCKISDWSCPYHACLSDDCQKQEVVSQGISLGAGKCPRNRMAESYREFMGFRNPPAGTEVVIKYDAGIKFFIWWPECPKENDGEDIIEGWFSSKKAAVKYAEAHGWKWKDK
jgi:hypothetical protein